MVSVPMPTQGGVGDGFTGGYHLRFNHYNPSPAMNYSFKGSLA